MAFDEGTAKESVDELLEKLKRKKPKEFAFLKANDIPPEEPLVEPPEEAPVEVSPGDVPPGESPSTPSTVQDTSLMEQELTHGWTVPEESWDVPPSEPPPIQATLSMEQDMSPEDATPEEPGDELPPEQIPAPPPKKRAFPGLRTILILAVLLVSLGLYAYFVYPTMYENRTVQSGDTTYPVRINRLTKNMQYYQMGAWHDGPILKTATYRARLTVPPKVGEALAVDRNHETTEGTPAGAPETATVPSVEAPPEKEEDTNIEATETKEEEPEQVAVIKDAPPPKAEVATPAGQYFYAIQISSMRLRDFAEELLEEFRQKGLDAHMRIIETGKHGVWYAIYIGHFADRKEAATYMKEKNISDSYPGSYIRKISSP